MNWWTNVYSLPLKPQSCTFTNMQSSHKGIRIKRTSYFSLTVLHAEGFINIASEVLWKDDFECTVLDLGKTINQMW